MVLNYIFIGFFIIAFVIGLIKMLFLGDMDVFPGMMDATFSMAKTGFEISLYLTGVLSLWMGIMKIGEKGGMIKILSRFISPFFEKIFPELPKNHPAYGSIIMNVAANMLGLDNAATPLGLKAMEQMQESNSTKDTASNPMIMFLVLNTSGLTLIPISIMVYRAQLGAADPSDVFLPILFATFISTLAGLIITSIIQKINLLDKTILSYLGGLILMITGLIFGITQLDKSQLAMVSKVVSNVLLFSTIITFILIATKNKVNVYEAFIEGAKEGFPIAIKIIPYLIGILVAIGVFRASGAMNMLTDAFAWLFTQLGINTAFIEALPTALMKPLSGSGARGMMVDAMETHGADSFVGRVASTVQGATDTTFYIIALYFGSVGIKKTRHAVGAGLFADFVGIIAAITMAYVFFY